MLILGNNGMGDGAQTLKPIDLTQIRTKVVELRNQMDPANLAEQAVGLNLKLMKWR